LRRRRNTEQTLASNFVVLTRNTTWRCGKLERSIVCHLHKRNQHFGRTSVSVNEIMENVNVSDEKQTELLDAIRRLEKRNIVRLLPIKI
jgi:hypothetical protein